MREWTRFASPQGRCRMPRCSAVTMACVRSPTSSRLRMMFTCHFTVASAMPSAAPISLLLQPPAINCRHLDLARAQLRLRPPLGERLRDGFWNHPPAGMHLAHRRRDLGVRHALEQIGVRARVERAMDVLVAVVGGQHDETDGGADRADRPNGVHAARAGKPEVHEDDVDEPFLAERAGFLGRCSFAGDGHVGLQRDDGRQPEPDHRVVIDDEDPNRRGFDRHRNTAERLAQNGWRQRLATSRLGPDRV